MPMIPSPFPLPEYLDEEDRKLFFKECRLAGFRPRWVTDRPSREYKKGQKQFWYLYLDRPGYCVAIYSMYKNVLRLRDPSTSQKRFPAKT